MPFERVAQMPRVPVNWKVITHIRLCGEPDSDHARVRWEQLQAVAENDGLVSLAVVLRTIQPVRRLPSGREAAIRSDLRNWSNPRDHGNNSQDKGWIELGRLS